MTPIVIGCIVFGVLSLLAVAIVYAAIRSNEVREQDQFTGEVERDP